MVYCSCLFFFKQKTAYEMRISDWSSDVCSSDLVGSGNLRPMPGLLFLPRRVFASRDQLPRLIATPARLNQADFGIGADAQLLLPAIDTGFQPPEFAAGRPAKQEQPARVTQLVGLGPGLRKIGRASCRERVVSYV